jgi:hypothetical protein
MAQDGFTNGESCYYASQLVVPNQIIDRTMEILRMWGLADSYRMNHFMKYLLPGWGQGERKFLHG